MAHISNQPLPRVNHALSRFVSKLPDVGDPSPSRVTIDLAGYRHAMRAALTCDDGFARQDRGLQMSERLETLRKARERMVEDRDAFAKVLAAPFDRDKAERARVKFTEIQVLIDAIDRAIAGEKA
jgi:hypothetical protein